MNYIRAYFIYFVIYLFSSTDSYTTYCEWCDMVGKVNKPVKLNKPWYVNKSRYGKPSIEYFINYFRKTGYGNIPRYRNKKSHE